MIVFGMALSVGVLAVLLFSSGSIDVVNNNLTAAQIAAYARTAGFSDGDLTIAVAVALAESGGKVSAHGDTGIGSGTGSFGLWQIYSDAHPEYGPDFTKLYDPQANANAAFAIFTAAGDSFAPWSTFNSGAYQAYLGFAGQGVSA